MRYYGNSGVQYNANLEDVAHLGARAGICIDNPNELIFVPSTEQVRQRLLEIASLQYGWALQCALSLPHDVIVGQDGNPIGFVFETIPGGQRLRNLIAANSLHGYNRKLAVAKNLCVAMEIAHRNGVFLGGVDLNDVMVDPQSCRVLFCNAGAYDYTVLNSEASNGHVQGHFTFKEQRDRLALAAAIYAIFANDVASYDDLAKTVPGLPPTRPSRLRGSIHRLLNPFPGARQLRGRVSSNMYRMFVQVFKRGASRYRIGFTNDEWYRALSLSGNTLRARLSRLLDIVRPQNSSAVTSSSGEIVDHARSNVVEESFSQPQVFWRVLSLLAVGYGLLCVACGSDIVTELVKSVGAAPRYGAPWLYLVGSLFGCVFMGSLLRRGPAAYGFKLRHYIATAAGLVMFTPIVQIVSGAVMAG